MDWSHAYQFSDEISVKQKAGIALVVILPALVYTIYVRALPKPIPSIPFNSVAAGSFWGDITSLSQDTDGLAQWCSKQLRHHGYPLCQVFMGPFSTPVVLVADVGKSRENMMRSDFDRSVYIIDRFPLFGGSQIIMRTGDKWRTSRGWLKDLLTSKYLQSVVGPAVHISISRLIELWQMKTLLAGPDGVIDMVGDLTFLALDVVTEFHCGKDTQDFALKKQIERTRNLRMENSEIRTWANNVVTFPLAPLSDYGETITQIGDRMGAIYTQSSPPGLVSWWTRHMIPRYRRLFAIKQYNMRKLFADSIDRLRNGKEASSAIDHMVFREDKTAAKAGRKPMYKSEIMMDEAFGNHIAGQHTTGAAMVWVLKYLTENPGVQSRLRQDIHSAFSKASHENRLPTSAEIISTNLPYLDAVIEETLRLRAAFIIARDAIRDTELLGHEVPKGTVCLLVCQGVEDIVGKEGSRKYSGNGNPDLQVFDPERWLLRKDGKTIFDGSSNAHMAFGLGIRACWGRRLAELEMRMMTAMVIWSFDLLSIPDALASHEAVYDFSYRAKHGYLRLRALEE